MTVTARVQNYTRDAMPPEWRDEISIEEIVATRSAELDALAQTVTPKIKPAQLTPLIGALHDLDDVCDKLWNKTNCRKSRVRELYRKADEIESRLAKIFGAQRGWKLSRKRFPWSALIGDMRDGDAVTSSDLPPFADHPIFYSDLDGKPVALAAQEYSFTDSKRAECAQFAMATGIAFEAPDFPSWHAPGTTLVLWRRKD